MIGRVWSAMLKAALQSVPVTEAELLLHLPSNRNGILQRLVLADKLGLAAHSNRRAPNTPFLVKRYASMPAGIVALLFRVARVFGPIHFAKVCDAIVGNITVYVIDVPDWMPSIVEQPRYPVSRPVATKDGRFSVAQPSRHIEGLFSGKAAVPRFTGPLTREETRVPNEPNKTPSQRIVGNDGLGVFIRKVFSHEVEYTSIENAVLA